MSRRRKRRCERLECPSCHRDWWITLTGLTEHIAAWHNMSTTDALRTVKEIYPKKFAASRREE